MVGTTRRRTSGRRALSLWANGVRVGVWRIEPRIGHVLAYDPQWAASPLARPLSQSLPLEPSALVLRTPAVERYFDNLLPDSEPIRKRIRDRFRTPTPEAFELLKAIGRDCVGALQLLPEDDVPEPIGPPKGEPLSDAQIGRLLAAVPGPALPMQEDLEDFRISIAGAQEKTALLRIGERWHKPLGATPTTHILKLPLGRVGNMQADMATSVENEWLCLQILRTYGLPVTNAEIGQFEGTKALVVQRFDRMLDGQGRLVRLMQEDFCQALGLDSSAKYESMGGPGMRSICSLLLQSDARDQDLETFWRAQVLFAMLAATDGHAKNFSIRLLPRGAFRLTPLYDVLSAWPVIGSKANHLPWQEAKLSMAFRGRNAHYRLHEIRRRHLIEGAAHDCFIASTRATTLLDEMIGHTPAVIDVVAAALPAGFPQVVADSIFRGLGDSARRLSG